MNYFRVFDYFLIIVSIFSHYPYGKLLKVPQPIGGSLVGLAVSACIISTMANVCSFLIRPFIVTVIGVGILLLAINSVRWFRSGNKQILSYVVLVLFGGILFLLNNPRNLLTAQTADGRTLLFFDGHHSYYAAQSVEMLTASYWGRLRIPNMLPFVWCKYHFFNASVQAAAQGLVAHPGLLTYYMSQGILIICVLLSFAERMAAWPQWSVRRLWLFVAFLSIGFAWFGNDLTWNLMRTGTLSIFAAVQLVFALTLSRSLPEALLYCVILTVSAVRLIPIGIVGMGVWALTSTTFSIASWLQKLRQVTCFEWLGITVAAVYVGTTLLTGSTPDGGILGPVFSTGWLFLLASYRLIGYFMSGLFTARESQRFSEFNYSHAFDRLSHPLNSLVFKVILIGILVAFVEILVRKKIFQFLSGIPKGIVAAVVLCMSLPLILGKETSFLVATVGLYPLFTLGLSLALDNWDGNIREQYMDVWKRSGFFLVTQIGTIYLMCSGLNGAITVPAASVTFDAILWGLIGSILLHVRWNAVRFGTLVLFVAGSLSCLGVGFAGIQRPFKDDYSATIDITSLLSKNFKRADYVDEKNFLKVPMPSVGEQDAYSSLLAAYLGYNKENEKKMISYRFANSEH